MLLVGFASQNGVLQSLKMSAHLVNVDRRTPLLLPPDLREWIPADDMVHFVIEAVEGVGLSRFQINERGSGSEH